MRQFIVLLFILCSTMAASQNKTDVSLFMKDKPEQMLDEVFSESGDLYQALGHHGPAVENEYLAFRIYFSRKAAIDIYSKTRPGLELKEAAWYPSPGQQKNGWGADYYKAGETVGLGGIRLWDGQKVIPLDPVTGRYARVRKEGSVSFAEMLSQGIPYKGGEVDILVRLTVFSGHRKAKVEAFALCDEDVQFVTGINYHEGQELVETDRYIAVWGMHPEDVAAEKVELGSAIMFIPQDFVQKEDDGTQKLLISAPGKQMECWISSANAKEIEMNTFEAFMKHIENP